MRSFGPANSTKYWDLAWVQHLYKGLGRKDSLENEVDQMWTNILTNDFPPKEAYNVFVRDRTNQNTLKSPDIMVKQLQNGNPFTIIIMENKRAERATQNSAWEEAVEELVEYLDIERASKAKLNVQIGLVAIGRYIRFYRRLPQDSLMDYPGTNGKPYEVRNDLYEVQDILLQIKEETKKE